LGARWAALENAALDGQRLFEADQRRAARLAIINSVQEGWLWLDFQASTRP
jgi:hypothetical protein